MVILGGMGNIWGVAIGAFVVYMIQVVILKNINGVLETLGVPDFTIPFVNLHVDLKNVPFVEFQFLLYGIAVVLMMLLRPEGLFPSQRRRQELHIAEELSTGPDEPLPAEAAALAASPAPEPDPSSLPVGGSDVAGITDVDRGSPDTSEPGSGR
jgi:branched-chain amino acid transport system permease protein